MLIIHQWYTSGTGQTGNLAFGLHLIFNSITTFCLILLKLIISLGKELKKTTKHKLKSENTKIHVQKVFMLFSVIVRIIAIFCQMGMRLQIYIVF